MEEYRIVMLRHGQSAWNLENRFTGWTDVDLTDKGREEARHAGELIAAAGIKPRFYFTSYQKRAIHTLQLAADAMDRAWVPVIKDWRLNERHYGALQGLNKADTAAKYGDEQVHIWRRSYDVAPPLVETEDERYPGREERYAGIPADEMPRGESLQMCIARVRPCWDEIIAPRLPLYHELLVTAHGNSLRGLAMLLLGLTPEEVMKFEIPTGAPLVMTVNPTTLRVTSHRYL
ncbi:MAG: 2,3-diphosphoglycerate-dependent phosphoglycerate mutase [Candidatus Amulumruptor caecigallinarius]|nr:2,3-diphosphoglycerate-dependent phosphoglycerate mutase [Candidatus Amulumruptor caecigallinarius]MCM1396402.1 2,3-diphosphoglycerate-dependent phosphoglycerate mutase [Candidatus Amulumruptor caecigallinarius]MCM1453541.1 2,3-diphosphoglycerate-dependent phosphoglycerate mutase [bacterium]